ncbi:BldC family transcriptional regulator [Allosalinactinospora lopnorensis]|uniref:BldC family transcriptional regulator n=1 Tax=Allosalinactinospora lopnorensis TaxID=1352348 RepID=UPI000623CD7F|nr:BldC family transcriptional regulator [Allosalinactinospora lopnorensis]
MLLTTAEVAAVFRVHPETVKNWTRRGALSSLRTLGGHHRYRKAEVNRLLRGEAAQ